MNATEQAAHRAIDANEAAQAAARAGDLEAARRHADEAARHAAEAGDGKDGETARFYAEQAGYAANQRRQP